MSPRVPPLYFADKNGNKNSSSELCTLAPELLGNCLTQYADWGDLAKLACVQSAWKSCMMDAPSTNDEKWELAQALLEGTNGLKRNATMAMKLLQQLAGVEVTDNEVIATTSSTPFAPAMIRIAECFLNGDGVEENAAKGVRWLEAAYSEGKDVEAAHKLALLYEYGETGVEIDVYVAADWFYKAADGGHVEAMAEYALCCELGCGREQDDQEALEWYMRAANAGHQSAKFSVGEAFEEARGVPQSDEEACLWYYKAAVEGCADSKTALRRLQDIARIVLPGVVGLLNV